MTTNYNFDYILIGLVLIISVVGIGQIIARGKELQNYKYGVFFMLGGLMLILLSTLANNFFTRQWENEYIIAFLLLKKVSSDWFFRHLCSWGYIFLLFGTTMLCVVAHNKRNKN